MVAHAGRKIPVDGVIESGEATINEAPITGESMPAIRYSGDSVYAGTILMTGRIRIRVTGVGSQTVVGKLIKRVELAQALRPQIQTIGDRFAKRVVPSSFLAAGLVLLGTRDPRRALTMLLVACPCAARASHADRGERLHWELRAPRLPPVAWMKIAPPG